jgi:hypothetical protein
MDFRDILHLEGDPPILKMCLVRAVNSHKPTGVPDQSQVICKSDDTPASIPAHASFPPVCVEIDHPEICRFVSLKEDQAVCTNPKTTVAKPRNAFGILFGEKVLAVIHQDEIISGGLIFEKSEVHRRKYTF